MFRYSISFIFLLVYSLGYAQEKAMEVPAIEKDTLVYKTAYGLRLGADISKPILAAFNGNYTGFELVADYRIGKKIYLATEIGFEEKTSIEDYSNSTSKGNYIRVGFNYNAYDNWLDMNNEVFTGVRYGLGLFDQTLNSYTPNVNSLYFPSESIDVSLTEKDLTAHWTEFIVGIKVETLRNLFVSTSISYKIVLAVEDPVNFKTLFAPGFSRIFESGTGFGFNYTIAYLIPFTKK
ncbi:MAG: DUF6048 family protein [Polaribacter sp.]|nr:DUF6048 family protein [Polaribacter sp.]MDG1320988.1 DUF6048 family protein [Polaribacter sp.]